MMKHNDEVVIAVPTDVELTVSEQNLDYTTTFQLDDAQPQSVNTLTFSITDDATLEVVNTFGGIIPTGVIIRIIVPLMCALFIIAVVMFILWRKRIIKINSRL